ncbi:MAG: S9 family peptidase [Bacteroidia bacterium]|nr:S9 family peptidase [Bacteroidia bacterium]MDW8346873.1 S9 family peptidase [Bacteroidia bacterium]
MKKVKLFILSFFLLVTFYWVKGQNGTKEITLEDVWLKYLFFQKRPNNINWMKNSKFYTNLIENGVIAKFDITTGNRVENLFKNEQNLEIEDYTFNNDENKILIKTEPDRIYRRSTKYNFYVVDIKTQKASILSKNGKQMHATFSPNSQMVAFVRDNNIYIKDLSNEKEIQVTKDGKLNAIINGSADWVYEEEFSMSKAFEWSPDGQKIAFIRFDESKVKEFSMTIWGRLYPEEYKFKYPKAGESNALVTVWVYDVKSKKLTQIDTGKETDVYIPRIYWTKDGRLAFLRLNRLQNEINLFLADPKTGKTTLILQEKSDTYIDLNNTDFLRFLNNGKEFIWGSEREGFIQLYLYDIQGNLIRRITDNKGDVTNLSFVDEVKRCIYYISAEVSPLERHLFRIDFEGKNKVQLSTQAGTNSVNISEDGQYFILMHSAVDSPLRATLHTSEGAIIRTLENNEELRKRLQEYSFSPKEFFKFNTTQNVELNGWMIKPKNFDVSKKYPVIMFVYGGPGNQTVENMYDGFDFFWYQTLVQRGYIVVSVDNRGTDGRGAAFKKATYKNLGKLECEDQIEVAKYLSAQSWVDGKRIGIWGWSFGGYLTSLCMTKGADYFKAGIAVAPVTNWRYYDTIYTERFLQTPQLNPAGYDDNSPITHAAKLKGKYLIIHGTADDNVHFQNAVDFIDALIKANVQFESFYYPNRNHGIYGGNTRYHLYKMMTNFWLKNL